MSANACNVHVWGYFEKLPLSGNLDFFNKRPMVLGRTFPVSNFFKSVICSNDAKEADILDSFGLPLDRGV